MIAAPAHSTPTADPAALDAKLVRIRNEFPTLSKSVHGRPLVYLDNAATSQKPRAVIERMLRYYEDENSNVHRGVHELSQAATDAYEEARRKAATFIGASESTEVVFTRGTTEAINLVAQSFLRPALQEGDEILLTLMEHHSNIVPWQLVATETGAVVKAVPVDEGGNLDYGAFSDMLGERTRLVSVAHISNVLGTVNDVRRIVSEAHDRGVPVLIDGAQAAPHRRVDVGDLDCDFYAFSSHKMFGPTGIGVLFGKQALLEAMPPWQGGGDMIEHVRFTGTTFARPPHRFEAGTPNIAGVIGFAAAIDWLEDVGYDFIAAHEHDLIGYVLERLAEIEGIRFIGTAPERSGVVSFLLGDAHPYDVGTILDRMGIAVRTGHHCAEPLMDHYGIPGTVRASFALYNVKEDVDALCDGLQKATSMLR